MWNDMASVRSIKSVHFAQGVSKVGADYLLMCPRGHPMDGDSLRLVSNRQLNKLLRLYN